MKKYVLIFALAGVMFACTGTKKSAYKSVDARDVPERYINDFTKRRPEVKDVRWEMADSTTYFANFQSNGNDCIIKFTKNSTGIYYVIPNEYIPTDITDYLRDNYANYKLQKAYITDIKNVKCYEIHVANKTESKKLQFDLQGNFNKVIE